jgi:arylsulfate sulfotransferase
MTKKNRHARVSPIKVMLVAGGGILILFFVILGYLLQPHYTFDEQITKFVTDSIAQQEQIESNLRTFYQAGEYTFNNPLIIQDPYKTAPLTALLIFDTSEDSQISIHVPGKTSHSGVDFTFPGYQKHHEIPVYGLYADTLNQVTISMETKAGESAQNIISLQTEPLPGFLPVIQLDKLNAEKYSPGFNFSFLDNKLVFDLDGNIRWYSSQSSFRVFSQLMNGRFMFTYSIVSLVDQHSLVMMEQDLLGKIYSIYFVKDGIHHDIYEIPNGNLLVTSSDLSSQTVEDILLAIDRQTGDIVKRFDFKDYLDENRPAEIDSSEGDWLHLNSIVYDATDNTIIISCRAQSAVIKMTYPGMQIKWILGPHDNWSEKYQPYLLTPIGDDFEWPWFQHHATIVGENFPKDSIDILLFDNGVYRSFDPDGAYPLSDSYSRVVRYHIDQAAMTVAQVWEYGQERGSDLFSSELGSAYQLLNGDVLGTWGAITTDADGNPVIPGSGDETTRAKIIEIDPSNRDVVFEAIVPDEQLYRTLRANIYNGYSENNAYLSTPINITCRNDLVERGLMAWQDLNRWIDSVPWLLAIKRFLRSIPAIFR